MTATLDTRQAEKQATAVKPKKAPLSDRARAYRALGWRLAGPAFVVMMIVVAYPIVYAIYLSLFNDRITSGVGKSFVGLKNYGVILDDSAWWNAVLVSVSIMIITVIVEFVLGLALAMVMEKIVLPRRTLRTIVLIPYSIVTVVSAFSWQYAFQPSTGYIDHWIHTIVPAFPSTYDWFGGTYSSMFAIMISEIWKTTPFMSLLLLAGLAQVPGELQEAAQVDGATIWERLRKVTLPAIKREIMVELHLREIDEFRIFDNIFIMTHGSQNTTSVSLLAYNQLTVRSEVGLGSALSILLFIAVGLICFVFIKLFKTDLSSVRGE